jgi:hypothetical protein
MAGFIVTTEDISTTFGGLVTTSLGARPTCPYRREGDDWIEKAPRRCTW